MLQTNSFLENQASDLFLKKKIFAYSSGLANCQNPALQILQFPSFIERLTEDLGDYYFMRGELSGLLSKDISIGDKEHQRVVELTSLISEKYEKMITFFSFLSEEQEAKKVA